MCRSPGSLAPYSSSLPVCNLYHALWGCVPVEDTSLSLQHSLLMTSATLLWVSQSRT